MPRIRVATASALALALLFPLGCAMLQRDVVQCTPPAGADALWANPQTQYIVLGEVHGTAEMPGATAEIVCHAAARGAHVVFALEYPEFEEPALQAFVAGELDGATMMQHSLFWQQYRDGRSSIAMFAMLERIRALRQTGLDIDVIAVAPATRLSEPDKMRLAERFSLSAGVDRDGSLYDLGMAAALIDDAQRLGAQRVIFLVGNAHGVTAPSESSSLNIETGEVRGFIRMHAASALPRDRTLSLVFTHAGGETFAQTREGAGVHPDRASEHELTSPAIVIGPFPPDAPRWDGRIFIGPISASPPMAVQGARPASPEGRP